MISHSHVCVWLDHRQAKIFGIGLDSEDESVIREPRPHYHIHRKADHLHQGKEPPDEIFLKSIAGALADARGVLIVGPGAAKSELLGYLQEHFPHIAGHVWGVHPIDHPTDGEIVAEARRFFRGADRMHASG